MDIYGCQRPPSRFETFMVAVSVIVIGLCFLIGLPFALLVGLGVFG